MRNIDLIIQLLYTNYFPLKKLYTIFYEHFKTGNRLICFQEMTVLTSRITQL